MVPTALSQIVEQIINAGVSIFATWLFMKSFGSSAIGAAGATMGTLAGAFGALIMLSLFFASRMRALKSEIENDTSDTERKRVTYRGIVLTMIPIILSQTVFQISFTVDDLIFGNLMESKGFTDKAISSLQGVFNTQYTGLVNLPIAISTALAASTLPAVVRLFVERKNEEKNKKIDGVIKLTMAESIPSAVGLAVLARPIMTVLFPSLITYREVAIALLKYGSVGCVFYSLSIITTSVLQGNGKMRAPVINAFISFVFHTVLIYALIRFTSLGIYARLIADVTFPLVTAFLNYTILKQIGYLPKIKSIFVLPLVISAFMGVVTYAFYYVMLITTSNMIISMAASLPVAIIVYGTLILTSKTFSDEELLDLPAGRTLLRLRNKIKR